MGYPAASCLSRSGGSGGHSILLSKALASQPVVSADKSMDPGALVHSVGLSPEVELCRGVRTGGIQGPTLWGGTSCSLSEPQFPTLWNVHYSKQAAKAQARSRVGAGYRTQHLDGEGGVLALVGGSPSSSIFALLKIRRRMVTLA